MSTVARFWWANLPLGWHFLGKCYPVRRCLAVALWLPALCLLWPSQLFSQRASSTVTADQIKAHQLLETSIQALGGRAWLDLQTIRSKGRTAAFFHGNPPGVLRDTVETTALPDRERIDLASKGQVVLIFTGSQAWEITYKGKRDLPILQREDYLRWRDHSLGVVLRRWLRDPATVLVHEGQSLVERRAAEKIKLISARNDAVTLEIDTESHLPLRLSFQSRDPQFHDKNLDTVEYDNYQRVQDIATPFTITWTHNGETVRQRFFHSVEYNVPLPKNSFDPDVVAAHLK